VFSSMCEVDRGSPVTNFPTWARVLDPTLEEALSET
jgi:hypothetical protein